MFFRQNHLLELLHEIDPAKEVDFQDFFVHADVGVESLFALRDARVEHEKVDAQVVGNHIVIETVDGGIVVELGLGGPSLHAMIFAHCLGLVEVVDAQASEDEVTAFLGQVECNALPDAGAATSDECGFVFEV